MILLLTALVVCPGLALAGDGERQRVPRTALWQWPVALERTAPDELDPRPALRHGGHASMDHDAWADQVRDRYQVVQAAAAPARGRLTVFSVPRPGAQVYVDGVYKGITPTMLWVTAGVHLLRVGFAGLPSVEREVDLRELATGSAHEVVVDIAGTYSERPLGPLPPEE